MSWTHKDRILALAAGGLDPVEITERVGCARQYTYEVLRRAADDGAVRVTPAPRGCKPGTPRFQPSRGETDAILVREMFARGVSKEEIKRRLRMGGEMVRRILGGWTPGTHVDGGRGIADVNVRPAVDDLADLYDDRTYEDDPRAAARPSRPVVVRPYLPQGGALGEAMS